MGLDQRLYWIGKPSLDQVRRLHHRKISDFTYSLGMEYVSEEDYHQEMYKYIRKYMIAEEVYIKEIDWKQIEIDCGVSEDEEICKIGRNSISYRKAMNVEEVRTFHIDIMDEKYTKYVLRTQYFYLSDEIYRWRNKHEMQELFNKKYPEIWNENKNKYETLNCGYYPIKGVLGKMKKIDLQFANSHEDGVSHVFYNSDW